MLHLGDITKIDGHTTPIVDCIIGGSPCQDLSVAGRRAGLDGERSGLFMEQVRIAKEMREADVKRGRSGVDVRPRYMVWENVPGAFSSNGGEDFRVVLEELARVVEEGLTIPRPPKGKWATTGVIIGDNWSLAWKVFDSQWWGVPQRRRRICLLVDFNGHTAPSIVFSKREHHGSTERGNTKPSVGNFGKESRPEIQSVGESLSRNNEQSLSQREEAPTNASRGIGAGNSEGGQRHVGVDLYNTDITGDVAATLGINCGMSHGRNGVCTFEPGIASREGGHIYEGVSGTLRSNAGDNQMSVAYTMQDREGKAGGGKGALIAEEKSATLRANNWQYVFQPKLASGKDVTGCLMASGYDKLGVQEMFSGDYTVIETELEPNGTYWDGSQVVGTLTAHNAGGGQRMPDKDNFNAVIQPIAIDMGGGKSSVDIHTDRSPTLTTTHYGEPAVVYDARGNGDGTVAPTMTGDHQNRVTDYTGVVVASEPSHYSRLAHGFYKADDVSSSLRAVEYKGDGDLVVKSVDCRNCTEDDINGSLQSNSAHSLNGNNVVRAKYIVRRLTPLECERLQGFPDDWTLLAPIDDMTDEDYAFWCDVHFKKAVRESRARLNEEGIYEEWKLSKKMNDDGEVEEVWENTHKPYKDKTKSQMIKWYNALNSDTNRYRALGNSIALPSWKFVLKRLCANYERDATMASLFDGIGGFPLIWEQINGKGSCLWASEIEEFPIAVTKERIMT